MAKYKLAGDNPEEFELPDDYKTVTDYINAVRAYQQQQQQSAAVLGEFQKLAKTPEELRTALQQYVAQQVTQAREAMIAEGYTKREATKAANQMGDDLWANYENLTPQQQAQTMINYLGQNFEKKMNDMFNAKVAQADQLLGGVSGNMQQQFDLLAKILDAKLANPGLNTSEVYGEMMKVAKASPQELMDLSMRAVGEQARWDAKLKEERAKWEEEGQKAEKAKSLQVLNAHDTPSWLKPKEDRPSLNEAGGEDKMRVSILSKALESGTIQPNQI